MTLSPQWLDELRSRLTLSSVIGRHVKIQRAGREYKACCPFHHEKTPSFTINDDKGFYHCFGCGAHGDVIRFMTDHQGLGFMDAIKELAAEAGMTVPAPDPRAAKAAEQRATLHDVCAAADRWFQTQLASPAGAEARAYLTRRGLDPATIKAFGIGFAPDDRQALKQALKEFDEAQLIEAGLLIAVDGKPSYDRFRGRVMIPIRDPRGRTIAFGGRLLGPGEPKYLNSPDTPLFDKGRTLYNLDRAAPAARQSGRMIVVEGYMDVIALAQAGFGEAVAPLGTALTEQQIERLWKQVDCPILCFDGDNAGQKAAMRAATRALPLLRPGYSLAFATLPPGQDPDDLVRSAGPAAFAALLDTPQPLLDRLWQHEWKAAPLGTPEARAGLKQRVLAHAETIADPDIRALYARELRERFSAAFFASKPPGGDAPRVGTAPRGRPRGFTPEPLPPSADLKAFSQKDRNDFIVRAVVAGLLAYPAAIARHAESLAEFLPHAGESARLLGGLIDVSDRAETLDTGTLVAILGERGHRDDVRRVQESGGYPFSFCRRVPDQGNAAQAERDLAEAIAVMTTRPRLDAALEQVTRRFEKDFDEDAFLEQQRLREQKARFDERLSELASREPTG